MLSIGKLTSGAERYYLETVASGLEEYYLGAGEMPGVWIGSASRELGLDGEVSAEALRSVLGGMSPETGEPLFGHVVASQKRVSGFDLTLSAPKSVSVLYGLGSDGVSDAVRAAHDEAVADALGYLEAHAALTRRGHNGSRTIATSGFVAASFRHRTSRAGDPQLHTHLLVANLVRGDDGRWSSLHAMLLYCHGRTAGFVYQASLRAGIVERLGVSFQPVSRGSAEVSGMSEALLREFSTRRAEVLQHLGHVGASSPAAAQVAALATRRQKGAPQLGETPGSLVGLRDRWRARAAGLGVEPSSVDQVIRTPRQPLLTEEAAAEFAGELLGPQGLTAERSSFERRDVVRQVAERLTDGGHLALVERLTDAVLASPEVVGLGRSGKAGEEQLTTREMLRVESLLVETARTARELGAGVVGEAQLVQVLSERPSIADEQSEMVRRLTTSGHGVEVVIGKAGAGKTYALDAARAAWQRSGFSVRGTALAARAAAELQDGSGIPSETLARLRSTIDRGEFVPGPRDVIVVDEAGMVGTRALASLVREVTSGGGKVVLVGDPRQLPEIEAGGGLAAVARRIGHIELSENRRQATEWERLALDELRHGDVGASVAAYAEHGRVHFVDSAPGARRQMAREWAAARTEHGEVRMYAIRRSDVEDLNRLGRAELQRRGELGPDLFTVGDRSFAAGDEVVFLRNDAGLGVLNGTRGRVVGLGPEGCLDVETAASRRLVPMALVEEGRLAHGYATTIHKAQGATVDRAFVLGGESLFREAGYVAMSRAVAGTDLYVVTSAFEDGRCSEIASGGRLSSSLSRSEAKQLAIEMLDEDKEAVLLEEAATLRQEVEAVRPADPAPLRDALSEDRRRVARSQASSPALSAHFEAEERRVQVLEGFWSQFIAVNGDRLARLQVLDKADQIRNRLRLELASLDARRREPRAEHAPTRGLDKPRAGSATGGGEDPSDTRRSHPDRARQSAEGQSAEGQSDEGRSDELDTARLTRGRSIGGRR